MAKARRKTLPKDFEAMLAAGDVAALQAAFATCALDARGGVLGQAALAFAACPDELARWLVDQGADLSAVDRYGETALHARAGHWQGKVDLLLDLGADVNHPGGGRGTPLHRAAAVGNLSAARALLHRGASPNAINAAGQTPLLFALHSCSNATLDRMAPMAELLLPLMAPAEHGKSWVSRIFGSRGRPAEPANAAMREQVARLGATFEFHRAGFNRDAVDQASAALDRLYALFGVPPVPRRAMHDGTSPIVAAARDWQRQHLELWHFLVPSSGSAQTVQGEVIRISGRISDELQGNGGANWDADYLLMVDVFQSHLSSGNPLPPGDLDRVSANLAAIKRRSGDTAQMCRDAVAWVARNPQSMPLSPPPYAR